MGAFEIVFGSVLALFALIIIVVILLQEGRQAGISGAISGGADTFLSKNKARTFDSFFAKSTKWIAICFFALTIALDFLIIFKK